MTKVLPVFLPLSLMPREINQKLPVDSFYMGMALCLFLALPSWDRAQARARSQDNIRNEENPYTVGALVLLHSRYISSPVLTPKWDGKSYAP